MVDDNILMPSLETNRAHIYLLFCTYYSRETQRGFGGLCVLICMFQFFKEIAEFFGISECSLQNYIILCYDYYSKYIISCSILDVSRVL